MYTSFEAITYQWDVDGHAGVKRRVSAVVQYPNNFALQLSNRLLEVLRIDVRQIDHGEFINGLL